MSNEQTLNADRQLPPGAVAQAMPKAPSAPTEMAPPPASSLGSPQGASAPGAELLAAHHERVASLHAHFVQVQEHVHVDFLQHRRRILEGLENALASGAALDGYDGAPAEEDAFAYEETTASEEESIGAVAPAAPPLSFETTLAWSNPLLDAHVLPTGLLLEPIARALAAQVPGAAEAPIVVDFEAFGVLPAAGESLRTSIAVAVLDASDGGSPARFSLAHEAGSTSRVVARAEGAVATLAHGAVHAERTAPHVRGVATTTGTAKRSFSEKDLTLVWNGQLFEAFGKGFERVASHTRTPPLPGGALLRLGKVTALEPADATWSTGYLHAEVAGEPVDTSPCRTRGLRIARVYQGALQALAFYLAATGSTVNWDGWRLEPARGEAARLRFLDAPAPEVPLEYELVVSRFAPGIAGGVTGTVRAWAGGTLVFYAENLSLRLVSDFPLSSDLELQAEGAAEEIEGRPAAVIEGFRIGYQSLLAGAVGRPTEAFREAGEYFESGDRQMPRLPGQPYHFITRITKTEGEGLTMRPGAAAVFEYDVPADAWYFDENGNRTMPFCVLLEAALQPCGWLSVYVGCPLNTTDNVFFRNLDGKDMVMTREVLPEDGTLVTRAKVISVARVSGVMLLSFAIECHVYDGKGNQHDICKLKASFGYFPREALAAQVGLPTTDAQRAALLDQAPRQIDLMDRPAHLTAGTLRLPGPVLLMLDRVSGYWPQGGEKGLGRLRGEKDVDPRDWFFRAHFFRDPVQPGSLGHEAMLQLLQLLLIEEGHAKGIDDPYFEPLAIGVTIGWRFRGQVLPESKKIITDVEVLSLEKTDDGVTVVANGSLWVDGVRCYETLGLSVRIRGGRKVRTMPPSVVETTLDPAKDAWVKDHRPNFTVPVMPMMSMVDRMAEAAMAHVQAVYPTAAGARPWGIVKGHDLRAQGWLVCDRPKRLRTEVTVTDARAATRIDDAHVTVTLDELLEGAPEKGAETRRIASGKFVLSRHFPRAPAAWPVLEEATPVVPPYTREPSMWGPRLQLMRKAAIGPKGATAELDAAGADAPIGALHHILLDGALHPVPHEELERWSDRISPNAVGVPVRLTAHFYAPPPRTGKVRAEIRFVGFDGASAFAAYAIQLIGENGVYAVLRHVEVLLPMGQDRWLRTHRRAFVVDRVFTPGVGLSQFDQGRTELSEAVVKRVDTIGGSVGYLYGLPHDAPVDPVVVAIKDHVGQRAKVHPSQVTVNAKKTEGTAKGDATVYAVTVERAGEDTIVVRDASPASQKGASRPPPALN